MSQTSKDKALQDADRESRIVNFLNDLPGDLDLGELEAVVLAILSAYIEDESMPHFLMYLSLKAKVMEEVMVERDNSTTH